MRSVALSAVNQSIVFYAFDADEAAVTLAFNSPGLSLSYAVDVDGREGAPVALTPIARSVAGVHEDGAITSKGNGKHEVDLPDAAQSAAGFVRLLVTATAVTGRVYSEVIAVGQGVELDTATLVRFVTEDTGQTTAAAGSVAKLAQGSAGGSTSVTVLPATGIIANRSPGITLLPVVGETISQSITVYETDGTTPVDLSGKTLKIIFETLNGSDVAVVLNADISVSGADDNVVTFAYPSAVTASERSLRFALRDAAAPLTMYLQGLCSVVSAPKVDV